MTKNKDTKSKGAAVDATTPKTKTIKYSFKDNTAKNQCLKLLDWLFEKGNITTAQARERLDILHPAGRIKELRQAGYQIVTVWDYWQSEYGIKHCIARYVLTQKEPVESDINSEVAA